jgi:hypothetical protein
MTDVKTTTIVCSCHDHMILVDAWDDGDLFMTIWSPTASKEWGRFHWMWESLRGRWNGDNDVIFDLKGVRELRDALSDHLAKIESITEKEIGRG